MYTISFPFSDFPAIMSGQKMVLRDQRVSLPDQCLMYFSHHDQSTHALCPVRSCRLTLPPRIANAPHACHLTAWRPSASPQCECKWRDDTMVSTQPTTPTTCNRPAANCLSASNVHGRPPTESHGPRRAPVGAPTQRHARRLSLPCHCTTYATRSPRQCACRITPWRRARHSNSRLVPGKERRSGRAAAGEQRGGCRRAAHLGRAREETLQRLLLEAEALQFLLGGRNLRTLRQELVV